MGVNKYFDESLIVKKNTSKEQHVMSNNVSNDITPSAPIESVQVVTNKSVPIEPDENVLTISNENISTSQIEEESTNVVTENIKHENVIIPDENFNIEVDINKQRDEYRNVIAQHNNKEEKPIYNISRENGTVKVEPQNKPIDVIQKEHIKPLTKEDIYKSELEKIKQTNQTNIIKAEIEINIYKQLIRNEANSNKNKTYQMRLDNFINELDFYKKRQSILDKM